MDYGKGGGDVLANGEALAMASFPRRFLAYVLDFAPFSLLWVLLLLAASGPAETFSRAASVFGWFVVFIGYFTVSIARFGRTLGMRAVGIRVISVADGAHPTWRRSFLRALLQTIARPSAPAVLTIPLAVIVYGPMFCSPRRRGLHDFAAATVVVNERWRELHSGR